MYKWFLLQKIYTWMLYLLQINIIHVQVFLFTFFQINIFKILTHILHFTVQLL